MQDDLAITVDKFIFRVAQGRLYSSEGVWASWIESEANGHVRIGVTDYLQQRNGDVAFSHVKPVGTKLAAGDEFAELETVKANASLFSPIRGLIVEVNPNLELNPELINQEPYGNGWLAVIEATNWPEDRERLLDAHAYLTAIRLQAEQELKG